MATIDLVAGTAGFFAADASHASLVWAILGLVVFACRLSARKGSLLFRGSRRTALTVMAAVFGLVGAALTADHFTTSSNAASRVVDGSAVEYRAGHQSPVPDITLCIAEAPTLEVA